MSVIAQYTITVVLVALAAFFAFIASQVVPASGLTLIFVSPRSYRKRSVRRGSVTRCDCGELIRVRLLLPRSRDFSLRMSILPDGGRTPADHSCDRQRRHLAIEATRVRGAESCGTG